MIAQINVYESSSYYGGNIDFNKLCYIPTSEPGSYIDGCPENRLIPPGIGIIMYCNSTY